MSRTTGAGEDVHSILGPATAADDEAFEGASSAARVYHYPTPFSAQRLGSTSVHRFIQAGTASGKSADSMRVYATFVQPHGLLWQLTRADHERLFGADYRLACPHSDEELVRQFRSFGEVDLNAVISFIRNGVAVGQASLNLLHNSFSRRGWLQPAADLYKGNGRVKHEHHRVHVAT